MPWYVLSSAMISSTFAIISFNSAANGRPALTAAVRLLTSRSGHLRRYPVLHAVLPRADQVVVACKAMQRGLKVYREVCSACHPFFTGQQKLMDTAGRVDQFRKRFRR